MTKNYRPVAAVEFPRPRDRNVNMMPFVMGDPSSVPHDLMDYLPLIAACPLPPGELGRVGYLTVDERAVAPGTSHRRPGLHTEGFGSAVDAVSWGGGGWGRGGPAALSEAAAGGCGGGNWEPGQDSTSPTPCPGAACCTTARYLKAGRAVSARNGS